MEKGFQNIAAIICALLGYMFGELDGFLKMLLLFIIIDYITGILAAIKNKKLSSKVGLIGICKKVFMLLIVSMAHVLDVNLFADGAFLQSAVCGFYIANEGISILENASRFGIPFPKKLLDVLKQLNTDKKDEDKKEDNDKKDEE